MTEFAVGTRVQLLENHPHENKSGTIESAKANGMNALIRLDEGGTTYAQESQMNALPVPEVGDLVRVTKSSRWQAQEGHVTSIDTSGNIFVDLDYEWERPIFTATQLVIIEKLPVKPVRIEGQPIKPSAIKRGDKISVVTVEDNEVKQTLILEAVVDKIVAKGFGEVLQFQTRSGAHIHTADSRDKTVISLVKDIDKDVDFQTLSQSKLGDIIAFPDEEGGAETNIAVKQGDDLWSVILGSKKAMTVETVGLVNILNKLNVTFSVIRTSVKEIPLPFPVGTNVRVKAVAYPSDLTGDYRVVIAGPDESTIKSRGISAKTHTVSNHWLTKN